MSARQLLFARRRSVAAAPVQTRVKAKHVLGRLLSIALMATLASAASDATGATTAVFSDDFESGNLSRWTVSSGMTVQQQDVFAGAFAARATAAGAPAFAYKALSPALTELTYDARFKVVSQGTANVSVVRLRTGGGGGILSMFRRGSNGKLQLTNDITGSNTMLPFVAVGGWHRLVIRVVVAGASSQVTISLDGTTILDRQDSLGTTPVGRIYIGDPASGRTFEEIFDDVVVSTENDVSAPSIPQGLGASAVGSTFVDLNWTASTDDVGVAGYTVYRNGSTLATVSGGTTSYRDTSVSPNVTYSYRVAAFDAAGNQSAQSAPASATTTSDTEPPTTPAGLTATPIGTSRIDLSWTASTDEIGVTGYAIYRDGGHLSNVPGGTTQYTDSGLTANTTYTYTVDAFDAAANHSEQSLPASATTLSEPPTEPVNTMPPSISGAAQEGQTLTAAPGSWTGAEPISYAYQWRGCDSSGGGCVDIVPATSDTYTLTGGEVGATIRVAVTASNSAGSSTAVSAQTAVVTAAPPPPDTTPPTIPTGLTASAVASNRVDLFWTASTDNVGVTAYTVYRDGVFLTTVGGGVTSYSDTTVTASTTYAYTVDAFDAAGNHSAASSAATVTTPAPSDTTPPTAPTGLTALAISSTRVDLQWNASTDNVAVTGYAIQRNGVTIASVGAGTTTYSDTTVHNSTTYTYTVVAFDAAANRSPASAPATVTTIGLVFEDGFESGNMSKWTVSSGLVAQQAEVVSGTWAARGTSAGTPAYAYKTLSPSLGDMYYDGRFKVMSQTTNFSLVRLRTSTAGTILTIFRRPDAKLVYVNEVTGITTVGPTVTAGAWHELEVHAVIAGASSRIEVWLDGVPVTAFTKNDTLGTANVGRVYIGDQVTGRTFDVVFDQQVISTSPDVTPPQPPTGVTTSVVTGNHVNVEWAAAGSSDVVTHTIYRNGTAIGTVGGKTAGWADFTAPASTSITYEVDAVDVAGNHSPKSAPAAAVTPPASGGDPVIAAAGDIACGPTDPRFNGGLGTATACRQRYTSDLVYNSDVTAVLPLGDNQYEDGGLAKFWESYDPSWGRLNGIVRPIVGNHEYLTAGASGYFSYFGSKAGDPTKGYYSYDIGAWHLVALNSECVHIGGCGAGSPQEIWLRADLAASTKACTLAYWHEPRFSSGSTMGSDPRTAALWLALHEAGAEIVLSGHEHSYERFAPQTPDGVASTTGIRQFVVGTGGEEHLGFGSIRPNSEARDNTTFGVLELTLRPGSYEWEFVPETAGGFTDSGSTACH